MGQHRRRHRARRPQKGLPALPGSDIRKRGGGAEAEQVLPLHGGLELAVPGHPGPEAAGLGAEGAPADLTRCRILLTWRRGAWGW